MLYEFAQRPQRSLIAQSSVRAPSEFERSEKGQSLISTYRSLAITASASGFEKLSTALFLIKVGK